MKICKNKLICLLTAALIMIFCSMGLMAQEQDCSTCSLELQNIKNEEVLPSKYDPRINGLVSKVKNQGSYSTCWCFASLSTLESYLINAGLADNNVSLSPEHLIYWSSRLLTGYGWDSGPYNGATAMTSSGYLTSFSGPIFKSDMTDSLEGSVISKGLLSEIVASRRNFNNKNKPYRVTDIAFLNNPSKQEVKENILKYGAVSSCIFEQYRNHGDPYIGFYSEDGHSYFCPNNAEIESINHRLSIIGWDDNYSRENFNKENMPNENGAWLAKDSHGVNEVDGGYMWVSYEDKFLLKNFGFNLSPCVIKKAVPAEPGVKVYQHDEYGATDFYNGNEEYKVNGINVYDFDSKHSKLNSIMICTTSVGAKYKAYYTPVVDDVPIVDEDKIVLLSEGKIEHEGYVSIKPQKEFTLPVGKGGIMIEIDGSEIQKEATIGIECDILYSKDNKVKFIFKCKPRIKSSFSIRKDKSVFQSMLSEDNPFMNFSIKAVTQS